MLSENVGFDVCELDFEQFVGEATLYHAEIEDGGKQMGAIPSENMNDSVHFFKTEAEAAAFAAHSHKSMVCISNRSDTVGEAFTKKIFQVARKADYYTTKSGIKLPFGRFSSRNRLFGFYEWMNIVANQNTIDSEGRLIVEAFRAFLEARQPAEAASDYFSALIRAFSEGQSNSHDERLIAIGRFVRSIKRLNRKALIVVDVQNDFCEGGSLAVPNSNAIFGPINELKRKINFQLVVLTKDMHPSNHVSFASTHKTNPFITIDIDGLPQELWPDHCVRGTHGSDLSELLEINGNEQIVEKGVLAEEDAYSGFGKKEHPTALLGLLKQYRIQDVVVVGLALDFCVGSTAYDAKEFGFETYVVLDATRAVMSHTEKVMLGKLEAQGIGAVSLEEALRMFD